MTETLRTALRPYRALLAITVALLLAQGIANLYLPSLNADLIDQGVLRGDTGRIVATGGLMLAVTLGVGACSVATAYLAARIAMSVGRDLRRSLFRSVGDFSLQEMNGFGAPSLITRTTNDVQQVQMLVQLGLTMMISAPILMIGGIVMALRENLRLSGLLAVILPLMVGVIALVVRRAVPLFRAMQLRVDDVNRVVRENLSGIRVIRAFVRTGHEQERFDRANAELTETGLRVNRLFAVTLPSLLLIMNLSSVAIVWFGGHLVDSGDLEIGALTAFLSYIIQILFAVMMAVMMVVMVPRAAASTERIGAVLAVTPRVADPQRPRDPAEDAPRGRVEFRGVGFGYPGADEPVLHDITLTLPPGRVTAVVGSTGSGKTTLLNLIPRMYDVTTGSLLVDGVDIREQRQDSLWSGLAVVPQRAFLFRGTIASNLRFGRADAEEEELWRALEVAQLADHVRGLPEGLAAPVEQGGANLSGGQRQRLSIARALVRRPRLYLFDDCFSALDVGTDARLRAALAREVADATVVIVAQRISTVRGADQIVVLDAGRVVGVGSHEQLLAGCEVYREIVESQLGAEEVA